MHPPVRGYAVAGRHTDLGDMVGGGESTSFQATFVDEEGAAVPSTWVHLEDPILALGQGGYVRGLPTLRADAQGRFRLEGIAPAARSLRIAAGSPSHAVQLVELPPGAATTVILRRRPAARLVVKMQGQPLMDDDAVLLADASMVVRHAGKLERTLPYRHPPLEEQRVFVEPFQLVPASTEPGHFELQVPQEGEHEVLISIPGGITWEGRVVATRGPSAEHVIDLPASSRVRVAVLPPKTPVELLPEGLRLSWITRAGPRDAVAWEGGLDDLVRGVHLWRTEDVVGVSVEGVWTRQSLWERAEVPIAPARRSEALLSLVLRDTSVVSFALAGADGALPVERVPIMIMPSRLDPPNTPVTAYTDASGTARARLRSGTYHAFSLWRVGAARWVEFDAPTPAGRPIVVRMW